MLHWKRNEIAWTKPFKPCAERDGAEAGVVTAVLVKICGTTSEQDALLAVAMGADAIGFIFAPSPRQVSTSLARDIVRRLPPEVLTIGVFRDESRERGGALICTKVYHIDAHHYWAHAQSFVTLWDLTTGRQEKVAFDDVGAYPNTLPLRAAFAGDGRRVLLVGKPPGHPWDA